MRHNLIECRVGGFGEIGTTQDYGTGVVRINRALGQVLEKDKDVPERGALWCIDTPDRRRRYALLRNINQGDLPTIWMEYEDRRALGLSKRKPARLRFRRARRGEYIWFLWDHTDPLVKLQFRMATLLSLTSLVAGVVFGVILT